MRRKGNRDPQEGHGLDSYYLTAPKIFHDKRKLYGACPKELEEIHEAP